MANLTTTIVSLNICAITSATKIEMLRNFLNLNKYDIVLLQEVSVPSFNFFGYREIVNKGPNNRGTAILYKENVPLHSFQQTLDGRGTSARFGQHTIVNVYAPSGSQHRQARNQFFGQTVTPLFSSAVDNILMAGDFNCVTRAQDCTGAFRPCLALNQLLEGLHLVDPTAVRARHVIFTHRTQHSAARLDRFHVSDALVPQVTSMHETPCAFTDHVAVACHINLGVAHAPRGPSYWKLNQAILLDNHFLPEFTAAWAEWVNHKHRYTDIAEWWDKYAKTKIKFFCLKFTSQMYKDENAMCDHLQQCLKDLMREPIPSAALQQQINEIKTALVERTDRRLAGLTIRSKCPSPVADEKASMHHVVRRHRRARSRAIQQLTLPDGSTTNKNFEILTHARHTLTEKFSAPIGPSLVSQYLQPQQSLLSEEDRDALGRDITEDELLEAVKASPHGKSPGSDGLPPEFYTKTWEVIKNDFLQIVKCVLARGQLTQSQTKGVLVLIPKTPQPRTLDQYRVLTLLNADYKIIARALQRRVTTEMVQALLHPTQVGAGTKRDITASLCDIREVIALHEHTKQAAALVSIDLKAAFDNVNHEYLFETLARLGLGARFTSWLKAMYTACISCVEINGYISNPFPVGRSVRQGCPLAMLLYSLATRPMVAELDNRLTGTKVAPNTTPFKVTNYVDDTQVVLVTERDYKVLKDTLGRFAGASGSQVNWQKSTTLLLGSWEQPPQYEFTTVVQTKILGIQFTAQTKALPTLNWPAVVNGAMAVLGANKFRQFTLEEKVWFVGTYALSKLWYVAKVVAPLAKNLTRVRVLVNQFLWSGRVVKLPYPVICLPRGKGGLDLHDALLRCHALYVARWWTIKRVTPLAFSATCLDAWTLEFAQRVPRACDHYRHYATTVKKLPLGMIGEGKSAIAITYAALRATTLKATIRVEHTLPNTDWPKVWANVQAKYLPLSVRHVWFDLVHDIMPTNERLNRIGLSDTDKCVRCQRWDTALHRATTCGEAAATWSWLKGKLAGVTGAPQNTFAQDFLSRPDTKYPDNEAHNTAVWLAGSTLTAVLGEGTAPPTGTVKDMLNRERAKLLANRPRYAQRKFGEHLARLQI